MNSTPRVALINLNMTSASYETLMFTNTDFEIMEHSIMDKEPKSFTR